jgi:endonuclease YncB( thermonuclease family)
LHEPLFCDCSIFFVPHLWRIGGAHLRADVTVVDGDTVDAHGQRYRMIGYDTPEVVTPRRRVGPDERAVATIAKERFVELLGSGSKALCHTPLRIKRSSPTELH